jgi:predicted DNA binding CopG/RHH family protein
MRRIKLSRGEQAIDNALVRGEYMSMGKSELEEIAQALAHRKKDAVLNIRVNSGDLKTLKAKARRHGIKYQTFIAELLHRVAHS